MDHHAPPCPRSCASHRSASSSSSSHTDHHTSQCPRSCATHGSASSSSISPMEYRTPPSPRGRASKRKKKSTKRYKQQTLWKIPKRGRPLLGAPFKVKGSTTIRYLAVNDDVAALLNKEIRGQVPSPQYKCPVDNCLKVCGNPGALAIHVSLRHPTFM